MRIPAGVLTVANGRGPVHIAIPAGGRGFRAACYRRVVGPRVESYPGRHAIPAWKQGPRCPDCAALSRRDLAGFLRAAGWA